MAYTKTTWHENGMLEAAKITALNNAEGQYDEMVALLPGGASEHDHDTRYYTKAQADAKYWTAANDGTGSGLVCEYLDGYSAQDIIDASVPSGCIGIWSGSEGSIPAGWVLCNGLNSTPDLRGRIPIGAGDTYAKGATGGNDSVTPTCSNFNSPGHALTTSEMPGHTHSYTDYYPRTDGTGGGGFSKMTTTDDSENTTSTSGVTGSPTAHTHDGCSITVNSMNCRPASRAYCYIMRS